MKPGLTCFWQIAPKRNDLSFNEWMRLDLKYIDTWSLFNDLKLIVLTLRAVVFGAGR
jgi:lipopolysaccharide/colanic/teichoic acid biosynthesis glycosyltransferase